MSEFANSSEVGADEIPSFNGSAKAKATDFANYFCSYAQLYHQKQMLCDHNRMNAYHSAIIGNAHLFKDKVVVDVGSGSGILAAWCALAGARRVFAVEYTDMASNAALVMKANKVDHIVTVVKGAIEDVELIDPDTGLSVEGKVDIIVSEWMGYFLLRESMMDSLIRGRDKFLKKDTGLMFPSHATMYLSPISDEGERQGASSDYSQAMSDWHGFVSSTLSTYGVDMSCLGTNFEKEQREYYILSSRWSELPVEAVIAEPVVVKRYDMATCTIEDSKGIFSSAPAPFTFVIDPQTISPSLTQQGQPHVVSGFAGWFTADFKSRTDEAGAAAPQLTNPVTLSTGPENGYTHWGQQSFFLPSPLPLVAQSITTLTGTLDMMRSKDNARLYLCGIKYKSKRADRTTGVEQMESAVTDVRYQMP